MKPKDVVDSEGVRKATGVGDVSEILRKGKDQEEMEVQLAAEAIETVFNEATTMEDLDKGDYSECFKKLSTIYNTSRSVSYPIKHELQEF